MDDLKIWATLLCTGLVSACGGGNNVPSNSVVEPAALQANGQLPEASSADAIRASATLATTGQGGSSSAMDRSATPSSDESFTTSAELRSIGVALLNLTTAMLGKNAASEALEVAGDQGDAPLAEDSVVHRLASSTTTGQFVRFSQPGHWFTAPTNTVIRYGDPASNRWVTKTATGYGECTNLFFRNDPAPGVTKVCQAWASTAEAIALANGPIWSAAEGKMPVIDLTQVLINWIGFSALQVQSTDETAPASDIGAFRAACGVAKLSFDDPIMYPGQAGKSHLHTFFGNTGVTASSTSESLRSTGTSTCRGGIANRSAYWVPTMIDTRTGTPLIATGNGVYYKTGFDLPTSAINPIPAGLRMIAGSASAGTPSLQAYRFKCVGGPNAENDKYGSEIGNCDAGASLIQEIFFPQCWDGVNLDAPDHKSHMAYPNNGKCPSDHPVAIPAISFNVEYPVANKDDPLYWRLSSDNYDSKLPGGYSSHGDWFNGWRSDISDAWGKNCVMASKDCHSHLLGDGRMMY